MWAARGAHGRRVALADTTAINEAPKNITGESEQLLCLSIQEIAPTGQRPLLKDSWRHNRDYVGGVTC